MMDRVKEALFSTLGSRLPDAVVLDLYAGSGSLGIEALSRGAARATFVERSRSAAGVIMANLERTGLAGEVIVSDVAGYLDRVADHVDLIFVDPPYRLSLALLEEVVAAAAGVLENGGVMVIHRRAGDDGPPAPEGVELVDDRRYGDSLLWIYERTST